MEQETRVTKHTTYDFDIKGQIRIDPVSREIKLYMGESRLEKVEDIDTRANIVYRINNQRVWNGVTEILRTTLPNNYQEYLKIIKAKRHYEIINDYQELIEEED